MKNGNPASVIPRNHECREELFFSGGFKETETERKIGQ